MNTNSFEERALTLAETLVEDLDPVLQEATVDAGWGYAIELTQKEGAINLEYFEFREQEIFDLEYGTEDRPPAVVVRPFLNKADVYIRESIENEALEYLFDKGILP